MNNNIFTFGGKYDGHSVEQIVFDHPSYINWMIREGIPNQDSFSVEQSDYFIEVACRASCLSGACQACSHGTVRKCGVTRSRSTAKVQDTWLLCAQCDCPGNFSCGYYPASLLLESDDFSRSELKKVIDGMKQSYFGTSHPDPSAIRNFFAMDLNFRKSTPGFFKQYMSDEQWQEINGRGEVHLIAG